MDLKKKKMLEKKQEQQRKEKENNPAYKYINYSTLDFPSLLRNDAINDYSAVDDKLEKLWVEVSLLEEQVRLRDQLVKEISDNNITIKISDGSRLMSIGEAMTQVRIADLTAYQSKSNIEKILTDMIQLVGIPLQNDKFILTEEEHNQIAMTVIKRVEKQGVFLFQSNRESLLNKLKE